MLVGEDADEVWENFCANYRFVQAAGGCVTDEHMRLLAIHRLGLWDLPKGKVDPGEAVGEIETKINVRSWGASRKKMQML